MIGHHNYNAVIQFELDKIKYITSNYDAYFCGHTHGLSEYNVAKQDNCFIFRSPSMLSNTLNFCSRDHINGFLVVDLYKPLRSEVSIYYQDNNGEFYMQRHKAYY